MRIQHNIMAMNAYRNYNNNTSALSKNLEKLSSGYKINRAGDDAAGLAISEKMRAQITGLKAASKNVKDGVSLVKTAEGALQEVHDMLNRMDSLATQSANGTYDDTVDRTNLQKEVNALKEEINRIADSSNFNGKKLLDGTMGGPKVEATDGTIGTAAVKAQFTLTLDTDNISVAATKNLTIGDKTVSNTTGAALTGTALADEIKKLNGQTVTIDAVAYNVATTDGKTLTFTQAADPTTDGKGTAALTAAVQGAVKNDTTAVNAGHAAVSNVTEGKAAAPTAAETTIDFTGKTSANAIGGTMTIDGKTYEFVRTGEDAKDATNTKVEVADNADATAIANALATATTAQIAVTGGATYDVTATAGKISIKENGGPTGAVKALTVTTGNMGLNLQIGDTSDDFNKLTVSVGDMHVKALGIADLTIADQTGAAAAIQKIKDAINSVSSTRGDLGAIQNRLEHTQNNLSVMTENIQDAEATIRDTDVADEMMAYTKNNLLIQSAQAMLAQANQVPQGVLQLLQ